MPIVEKNEARDARCFCGVPGGVHPEPKDPLPAMAESVGYVRGVLDEMAARVRNG